MKQKILACITIQQNSRRLIKKGAELAEQLGGELHILHVEQGNSILAKMIQENYFKNYLIMLLS